MSENVQGISGTVAPSPKHGAICDGKIISIAKGTASDFMSTEQYTARKTDPTTPYIQLEIGIADYGTIQIKSFRDYGGEDGTNVLSPNTMHGRIIGTYEVLSVDDTVKMIASKKDMADGTSIMVWSIVLA